MSELALIDAFLRPFGLARNRAAAPGVLVGPGDDCAVLLPARGQRLVATTDAVVEGVHFQLDSRGGRGLSALEQLRRAVNAGHKALAVNLSDLAAAGARPRWFLCAIGVPPGGTAQLAGHFARGMAALAREHGCALAGGNVTRAPCWSFTITALGEAPRPLSRSGGRPGDPLVVAGLLGDAALGLRKSAPSAALRAQQRPEPLVQAGLVARELASAAIDVSDGLLRDLQQLAHASQTGAEVECSALPLGPAARMAKDGVALALSGGEDYALLFAVRPARLRRLVLALRSLQVPAQVIGRLTAQPGLRLFEQGLSRPLPRSLGFDHLA